MSSHVWWIVSIALIFPSLCFSTTSNDFFCREKRWIPGGPSIFPLLYKKVIKGCGDGKTQLDLNICGVGADCVYVSSRLKAQAKAEFSKEYDQLTTSEKKEFFNSIRGIDWLPTSLSCPQAEDGCPLPEQCKGDLAFDIEVSHFSPGGLPAASERAINNKPKYFPAGAGRVQ